MCVLCAVVRECGTDLCHVPFSVHLLLECLWTALMGCHLTPSTSLYNYHTCICSLQGLIRVRSPHSRAGINKILEFKIYLFFIKASIRLEIIMYHKYLQLSKGKCVVVLL